MARRRREDYRKKNQHALTTNVRMQKIGDKPTREEMEEAWQHLRETHRAPRGWKVAAVDWTHVKGGQTGWIEGWVKDLSAFETIFDYMEDDIRIGIDREKSNPAKGIWEVEIAMEY